MSHRPHKCNDCGAEIQSGARCSSCQEAKDRREREEEQRRREREGPVSLASNRPLRLPLPTAAQVRAAVICSICGAPAGQPCSRRQHRPPGAVPANHASRVAAARGQMRLEG